MHYSGECFNGAHVLQVLTRPGGECRRGQGRGEAVRTGFQTRCRLLGAQPVYRVSRPIAEGVWTTDRRYSLDPGRACGGLKSSSIRRPVRVPAVLFVRRSLRGPRRRRPGARGEITHATIHDDVGPVIEEHPDLRRGLQPARAGSRTRRPRARHGRSPRCPRTPGQPRSGRAARRRARPCRAVRAA